MRNLVHVYYMLSVSWPIGAVAVLALALSSCSVTYASRSPNKGLPTDQENFTRSSSEPASAMESKSISAPITPAEPQVIQNPVGNSSPMNLPTANPSAIANSSAAQPDPRMALAQHLTNIGAKIYMVDWCSTCKRQQRDFGEAAFAMLTRINCEENPDVCADAGVRRYPTWEINGQKYERGFPLNKLAQLSNYSGPTLATE